MSKKIGYFLMFMLVLCAFLLLSATDSARSASGPERQTEPSVPEPTQTLVTVPDTSESQVRETQPVRSAASRVEEILEGNPLDQTAVSHCVYDGDLNALEGTTGADGTARALAQLAGERQMNPVAAFWLLVSGGLYEKTPDESGVLYTDGFQVPDQAAKQYAYSDEGAKQLVTDLLALAARMEDGLALELGALGANAAVEADQVHLSEEEGCRYGYFVVYGTRSTHFLCFYLRSGGEGDYITDVEFQLLNLRHASGDAQALEQLDRRGDAQAAALMAAAELLLTGQTQADQAQVPFSRQVGGYSAETERFYFTSGEESGILTNYRLRTAQ